MKFTHLFIALVLAFGIFGCTNSQATGSICDSKPDDISKFTCYFSEAQRNNDPKICENLPVQDKLGFPRDQCYWLLINYEYQNIQCNNYANESKKAQCFFEVANRKKNPDICDKMTNETAKDDCYSLVAGFTNDLSVCDKVSKPGQKDACYSSIAVNMKDESICEKISGFDEKEFCYVFLARKTKDSSYCNKIDPRYMPNNMSVIDYCRSQANPN